MYRVEMDSGMTGDIPKVRVLQLVEGLHPGSSVEIIHTMDEYKRVLDDAADTDQMAVLMVSHLLQA